MFCDEGGTSFVPFVEFLVYGKRLSPEQKEELYRKVNDALKQTLGSADGQVRIAIQENDTENYYDGSAAVKSDHI